MVVTVLVALGTIASSLVLMVHLSNPCRAHLDVVLLPSRCQSFPVSKAPSRDAATFEVTKWNLLEMSLRKFDGFQFLLSKWSEISSKFHHQSPRIKRFV